MSAGINLTLPPGGVLVGLGADLIEDEFGKEAAVAAFDVDDRLQFVIQLLELNVGARQHGQYGFKVSHRRLGRRSRTRPIGRATPALSASRNLSANRGGRPVPFGAIAVTRSPALVAGDETRGAIHLAMVDSPENGARSRRRFSLADEVIE